VDPAVEALIEDGQAALRRGDATAARATFESAVACEPGGPALEGLAEALNMEQNHSKESRDVYERAYKAYRDERDALGAYRAARMIAFYHGGVEGEWAVFQGWLRRASTLLEEMGGERQRGRLELIRGQYGNGADAEKEAHFREGLAIGRGQGDADLEFQALAYLGSHLVHVDRVDEGMPMLDEALAAVCAGELSDATIGDEILCSLLGACERAHDVARADQWMRAVEDLAERFNLQKMAALCRAHYGGILTTAGRWVEAERELLAAARGITERAGALTPMARTRLAQLRVHQGRFVEAETLLEGLEEDPDAARPLVAVHLARGEIGLARDRLERALAQPLIVGGPGPLLALLVDIELSAGNIEAAAEAAVRLTALAEETPTLYLKASAALAEGKLRVASSAGDARACFVESLAAFAQAGMPIEVAQTRLELARAIARERPEVAVKEATSARQTFQQLDMAPDADRASALLATLERTNPTIGGLTRREAEVFDLLGSGLSNAEIGERLYISRKTVEHHVGRVLTKLGLRSRSEVAARAARLSIRKLGSA
jgi:DNA-binding NarL/FixJ family response regulator